MKLTTVKFNYLGKDYQVRTDSIYSGKHTCEKAIDSQGGNSKNVPRCGKPAKFSLIVKAKKGVNKRQHLCTECFFNKRIAKENNRKERIKNGSKEIKKATKKRLRPENKLKREAQDRASREQRDLRCALILSIMEQAVSKTAPDALKRIRHFDAICREQDGRYIFLYIFFISRIFAVNEQVLGVDDSIQKLETCVDVAVWNDKPLFFEAKRNANTCNYELLQKQLSEQEHYLRMNWTEYHHLNYSIDGSGGVDHNILEFCELLKKINLKEEKNKILDKILNNVIKALKKDALHLFQKIRQA